jgi:hypothetical protein
VQRILHNLQFHAYKLQIVQELKPKDSVLHLQFCENNQQVVCFEAKASRGELSCLVKLS